MRPNIAAAVPMPSDSVAIASAAKAGAFRNWRTA
jgi:hypothetical protein